MGATDQQAVGLGQQHERKDRGEGGEPARGGDGSRGWGESPGGCAKASGCKA